MRKEIEVKARAGNLSELASKLESLGFVVSEPIAQRDAIFVDSNYGQFDQFQPDKNLLRIRESGEKFVFTIKQPKANQLDSIEHETEIANPEERLGITIGKFASTRSRAWARLLKLRKSQMMRMLRKSRQSFSHFLRL